MAETAVVRVHIDKELKEKAERILAELGVTPTLAIQMFYRQIILHRGIPFDVKLPDNYRGNTLRESVLATETARLSGEQTFSSDEVRQMLADKYESELEAVASERMKSADLSTAIPAENLYAELGLNEDIIANTEGINIE